MSDIVSAVARKALTFAVLVVLAVAVPVLASSRPAFKLTTNSGRTGSFSYIGFQFSSGATPKLGVAGKVEIELTVDSASQKPLLKVGPLKSATLRVVAKKVPKTYTLVGAKITSASFVDGNSGPSADVKLSYKKLTG
jgi:hypothetical protein